MLKLQYKALLLQLLIFRLVEAEEDGLFLMRRIDRLFHLIQHSEPFHLVVEVAAVETHVKYGLVEVLQFLLKGSMPRCTKSTLSFVPSNPKMTQSVVTLG